LNYEIYKLYEYNTCYFRYQTVWTSSIEIAGKYKVDRSKISVSGFSSGGAMATQMHVAYSSVFMGVGIISGGQ